MTQFLQDFPTGSLDYYRKLATFDWKRLKIFLDTEEIIEYEVKINAKYIVKFFITIFAA